jgi:ribosomal protein S17
MRAEMKAAAKKGRKSAKVGETVTIRDMVARQDFTGVVVHVTRSKNVTVQLADGTKKTGVVK